MVAPVQLDTDAGKTAQHCWVGSSLAFEAGRQRLTFQQQCMKLVNIAQQLHAGRHTWKLQQVADVGLLKRLGCHAKQDCCIMVATLDGAAAVHLQNGL